MATRTKKNAEAPADAQVVGPVAKAPTEPNAEVILKSASGMLSIATSFVIDSPLMFEAAGEQLKAIKVKAKELEGQRFGITRPMDEAKKRVLNLFNPALERLEQAESCLKEAMLHYETEQRARAAAAQKLLDDHAAKERKRTEEVARQQAVEAEKQQQLAIELEQSGNAEAAATARATAETAQLMATTLQATAHVMVAPVVRSAAPQVSGIRVTERWQAKVTDKRALLAYIVGQSAENPEFLDWVEVNMAPLHDMARALKKAAQIPGVETFELSGIAASSRV